MTQHEQDDAGELVDHVTTPADPDPVRRVIAAAVGTVLDMLPDGYARRVVVEEILETEGRVRARLIRRILN